MATLLDELLEKTDPNKKTLDDLLRETEGVQPAAPIVRTKSLDDLLAETEQPISQAPSPTLTPSNLMNLPAERERQRKDLEARALQLDTETVIQKQQSGQPLTPEEQFKLSYISGQADPNVLEDPVNIAILAGSMAVPPVGIATKTLGPVVGTMAGEALLGAGIGGGVYTGESLIEGELPDPIELAKRTGFGAVAGSIGGGIAGRLRKPSPASINPSVGKFSTKIDDVSKFFGVSKQQVNKELQQSVRIAREAGEVTSRGDVLDKMIGQAAETPEGAAHFQKYMREAAIPPSGPAKIAAESNIRPYSSFFDRRPTGEIEQPTGKRIFEDSFGKYVMEIDTAGDGGLIKRRIGQVRPLKFVPDEQISIVEAGKLPMDEAATLPSGPAEFAKDIARSKDLSLPGPEKFTREMGLRNTEDFVGTEKFAHDMGYSPSGLQVQIDETFTASNIRTGASEDVGNVYTRTFNRETMDELTESVKRVVQGIEDPLEMTLPKGKQMMVRLSEMINDGTVAIPRLRPIMERLGIDPVEFMKHEADAALAMGSHAGRQLNRLSQMSKMFEREYKGTPAEKAFEELAKKADQNPLLNKIGSLFRNTINAVRGSVVTQFATAARNDISQKFRGGIEIFDTLVQGMVTGDIRGAVRGAAAQSRVMGRGIADQVADLFTLGSYMKGKQPSQFMKILDDFPLEHIKLTETAVHEVATVNKYLKAVNFANRWQELHNRRIGFEMRFARSLARKGYDPFNFDVSMIPEKELIPMLRDAVDFGLDMSFANSAKNAVSKEVVGWFHKVPPLQLINYFPRFAFANAWQYIYEFSPIGFARFLNKPTRIAIANGNTEVLSRAVIGTALTAAGYAIRQSEFAGPRWYEIKVGDKTVDTRPFAPFNIYLFFGEMINNPKNIGMSDYVLTAAGMNRIQGTGLVLVDLLKQSPRSQQGLNLIKDFVGTFFGGLSVPARTTKDIAGGIQQLAGQDPASEAVYRDVDTNPLFGPFLSNIPGVGTLQDKGVIDVGLDPLYSPFSGGEPMEPTNPLIKQFSGVNLRDVTSLQEETNRLKLEFRSIYPSTGVPQADNKLSEYMGTIVSNMGDPTTGPVLLNGRTITPELYNSMPDPGKRLIMREYFKEVRARSMDLLKVLEPTLYSSVKVKRMDRDEAELMGIDKEELWKELVKSRKQILKEKRERKLGTFPNNNQ